MEWTIVHVSYDWCDKLTVVICRTKNVFINLYWRGRNASVNLHNHKTEHITLDHRHFHIIILRYLWGLWYQNTDQIQIIWLFPKELRFLQKLQPLLKPDTSISTLDYSPFIRKTTYLLSIARWNPGCGASWKNFTTQLILNQKIDLKIFCSINENLPNILQLLLAVVPKVCFNP